MPDSNSSSSSFPDPLDPPDFSGSPDFAGSSGEGLPGDPAPDKVVGAEVRELVLVKHGQRYVFRYTRGQEDKMLSGLADMARDPKSGLDWFDAAVLSHQMGKAISEQLRRLKKSS